MINRNESRKRVASNLSVKIDKKMIRLKKNNVIYIHDNVLADIIKISHREHQNPLKLCKPGKAKLMKSTGLTVLIPLSSKKIILREAFLYI